MYRIELEPGDVGVFRSVDEIATAIKSGVVTSRARIYHQATDKWLPIEFHPHYKQALELVASGGAQGSSSSASSSAPVSSSSTPSGPRAAIKIISAPRAAVVVAEPEPELQSSALFLSPDPPSPAPEADPPSAGFPPAEPRPIVRPRLRVEMVGKPRRPFLLALGAMMIVLATQLGLTAAVPQQLGLGIRALASLRTSRPAADLAVPAPVTDRAPLVPAAPKATPATPAPSTTEPEPHGSPSFGSSSAFTAAAPVGHPPAGPPPAGPARHEPTPAAGAQAADSILAIAPAPGEIAIGAPVIPVTDKPAPAGRLTAALLVTRYQAAYAAARAELETGFRTAGFANLFALDRLDSSKNVQAARLSAGTASAYVAKYRRREAEIEQAYADSFAVLSKQLNWSADERKAWENHEVLQERPEIAKLASFLLEQIDSLYGVLSSQEGGYDIKSGQITFQDAAAARAYAAIRPWLDRRAHQWADTASGIPTTAARVLRAIGSTALPEGGAL